PSLPVSENPVACRIGQNRIGLETAGVGNLLIPQYEEERLVPNDWAAVANRVLVRVSPIGLRGVPAGRLLSRYFAACRYVALVIVAVPRIGIQRRVSDVPDRGSRVLVRSRSGGDLDLRV